MTTMAIMDIQVIGVTTEGTLAFMGGGKNPQLRTDVSSMLWVVVV